MKKTIWNFYETGGSGDYEYIRQEKNGVITDVCLVLKYIDGNVYLVDKEVIKTPEQNLTTIWNICNYDLWDLYEKYKDGSFLDYFHIDFLNIKKDEHYDVDNLESIKQQLIKTFNDNEFYDENVQLINNDFDFYKTKGINDSFIFSMTFPHILKLKSLGVDKTFKFLLKVQVYSENDKHCLSGIYFDKKEMNEIK